MINGANLVVEGGCTLQVTPVSEQQFIGKDFNGALLKPDQVIWFEYKKRPEKGLFIETGADTRAGLPQSIGHMAD